jgi:hypothetical protein
LPDRVRIGGSPASGTRLFQQLVVQVKRFLHTSNYAGQVWRFLPPALRPSRTLVTRKETPIATIAQLKANRQNAQASTGTRSPKASSPPKSFATHGARAQSHGVLNRAMAELRHLKAERPEAEEALPRDDECKETADEPTAQNSPAQSEPDAPRIARNAHCRCGSGQK